MKIVTVHKYVQDFPCTMHKLLTYFSDMTIFVLLWKIRDRKLISKVNTKFYII